MNKLGIENTDLIIESMIKTVNGERKLNKNNWYTVTVIYKEYSITFKAYNTWVQRISINGQVIGISSGMDIKVSEFKSFLDNFFDSVIFGNYSQYKEAV